MTVPHRSGERRVIAVLFGVMFAAVADNQMISPLLPDMMAAFDVDIRLAGLLVSTYAIAAAVASFTLGPVSDLWGRRRLLLIGLAVFAVGTLLCGLATSYATMLVFRALTGAAAGTLSLNITAFIGDYFSYERRGVAMGMVMSGYFAAMIIGVPIGAYIAEETSWRGAFIAFAGIAVLLWWPVWFSIPVHEGKRKILSTRLVLKKYAYFISQTGLLMAVLAFFLISASMVGFITFVGAWLREVYGLSTDRIGLIFLVSGIGALLGSPLAGAISDRIGKRPVVFISSLVMAVCLGGVPWITGYLSLVFVGFIIIGIAGAFRLAPLQTLITGLATEEDRGALIALKNTCAEIGIGAGTAVCGLLYVTWGNQAVGMVCVLMTVLSAFMIWGWVEEPG